MSHFRQALAACQSAVRRAAGEAVIYQRGAASTEIADAVPALTRAESDSGSGMVVTAHVRDWLIAVAALVFEAGPVAPVRGDRIRFTLGESTYVFEVMGPGSEPVAAHTGPDATTWRVHTKLIDTEIAA